MPQDIGKLSEEYVEYLKLYEKNKHYPGVVKMTWLEFVKNRQKLNGSGWSLY